MTGSYLEYQAIRESEIGSGLSAVGASAGAAPPPVWRPGLPEAASRIAAIRRVVRPQMAGAIPRARPVSISDALRIAQRVFRSPTAAEEQAVETAEAVSDRLNNHWRKVQADSFK